MTYKKISPVRRSDFSQSRRKKPPINKLKRERKELLDVEQRLLQAIVHDAEIREEEMLDQGMPVEPLSVWNNFDHTHLITQLAPEDLPEWEELTERLKLHVGMMAAIDLGGWSFTVMAHREMVEQWVREERDVRGLLIKRMRRALHKVGMKDVPYGWAIETRSRSGKSKSNIHLHGFVVDQDDFNITKFKIAAEKAWLGGELKRMFRGRSIDIKRAYDVQDADGPGRWVNYATKYISSRDNRVPKRRLYISRALTQTAREMWWLWQEKSLRFSTTNPSGR